MTTATTYAERMAARDAACDKALAEYAAEIARHGHDYDGWVRGATPRCRCGAEFRTRRSVGMHVAAAEKRASNAHDKACSDAIRSWMA